MKLFISEIFRIFVFLMWTFNLLGEGLENNIFLKILTNLCSIYSN